MMQNRIRIPATIVVPVNVQMPRVVVGDRGSEALEAQLEVDWSNARVEVDTHAMQCGPQ